MSSARGSRPSRALRAVRAADWWAYKIPPLLSTMFAGFLLFDVPPRAWLPGLGALACILMVAVYGYVLNDISDVDADRRSGRPNRMASMGTLGRTLLLVVPALASLTLGAVIGDRVVLALLALNLLVPTLYSVPPVRLKERGVWGALADAAGVHAVPMAVVARASTLHGSDSPLQAAFIALASGLAALAGLRGIVLHQNADREADASAGVQTFGGALGTDRARGLVLRRLLPAELLCLAAFVALLVSAAPMALALVAVFLAIEGERMRRKWKLPLFEPAATTQERYIPIVNNELYEVWLPLALALQLALVEPLAWFMAAAQVVLFFPNLKTRAVEVGRTLAPRDLAERAAWGIKGLGLRHPRVPRVVVGTTSWTVNGVNVFSANLVRGLTRRGVHAEVLLTEEGTNLVNLEERPMPRPAGVRLERLPVGHTDGWGMHWGVMVRSLEEAAPCIYIPNSDWRHSCVSPQLSDQVVVVGIVHSDDPLHYDHVRRLGPYWNAVVAVSSAVANRTLEACPSVADRLFTIPIGVSTPKKLAVRPEAAVLRVIYHGIFKQHQKRVLDFPKIVEAARACGVPVELTLVGSGPDEPALREASARLADEGSIRFLGVISPDETGPLLETQDVYLLASEFEGMPNALIEAMGRGCVPVVTRMTSGIPELVRDGKNGLLVPIGDVDAFAGALESLWKDPQRLRRMSAEAYRSVRKTKFQVDGMVAAYLDVFERAATNARKGRFVRPKGPLLPPPREVAGVSIFPIGLPHLEENVGAFPSAEDAREYADEVQAISKQRAARRRAMGRSEMGERAALERMKVFVTAPVWTPNGVNAWSEDLVRGLRHAGLDARLLLTEESTGMVTISGPRLARPTDLPTESLQLAGAENWGARWGALLRMLEAAAPCVYFPNYDWRHSSVVPLLSSRVVVIGTVHDSGAQYTEHAARLGDYLNAVVATARPAARHLRTTLPGLRDRLALIPHGCWVPQAVGDKPLPSTSSTQILIVSAAIGEQDSPRSVESLARALEQSGLHAQAALVGRHGGATDTVMPAVIRLHLDPNREEWLKLCGASHFVVVRETHHQEVWRMAVEAMGHGCVPLMFGPDTSHVTLLRDGDNGVLLTEETWPAAFGHMQRLVEHADEYAAMSARAHRTARLIAYRSDQMIDAYLNLFGHLVAETRTGNFVRPQGTLRPPPATVGDFDVFPLELTHPTRFGPLPSAWDADRFFAESGLPQVEEPEHGDRVAAR